MYFYTYVYVCIFMYVSMHVCIHDTCTYVCVCVCLLTFFSLREDGFKSGHAPGTPSQLNLHLISE